MSNEKYETLGENVIPSRYVLEFKPNFRSFTFEGRESIYVRIRSKTSKISLNSAELKIKRASVISKGVVQKAKVSYNTKLQQATLSFKSKINGDAELKLDFTGINNANMYGFYRSRYPSGKETKYILTTQFEAANARNAFPCFDEPAFKATFDVSFVVDKELDCISNMPQARSEKISRKQKRVTFKQSPRMSTYLLYLGVGRYEYVGGAAGKTKVRVITTPGHRKMAKLPLDYTIKFIKFFEKYFGIPYPMPKVDMIAIPDFAAGAMENWGAITFREVDLLADENTSVAGKQRVAEVIAHELAHQWFGDLVTMKWWNDLWLNESFATFMSYKAMNAVFPEWKMKVEYIRDVIATAFGADQLKSTHPISVPVRSPSEIDQIFDEISYEKGGTVLNMLENYATEPIFREGLHQYLKEHSYSNATKFDLWGAIDKVAKKRGKRMKVTEVASYWIDKPGYPIIDVKRRLREVSLTQSRFFLLSGIPDRSIWPIPITYSVQGDVQQMLMDRKSATIGVSEGDWIKLNIGQNGLYRTSYEKEDVERLGSLIRSKQFSGVDSWGIEHDIFSRIRSGRQKVEDYLEFADSYCLESDYPLNSNVLGHLGWLHDMLYFNQNEKVRDLLLRHANSIIDKLGWERRQNESTVDTIMRGSAIAESGLAGYQPTVVKARELFDDFIKNGKEIDPNLRSAVYSINACARGDELVNVFKERFQKEKVPDEKVRFLRALSMFSDPELLKDSLAFSLSDKVRLQDGYMIPALVAANPVGRPIIWRWTKEHWKELMKRYASGTHMLGRFVSNLSILTTESERKEIEEFFGKKENYRDDIKQALKKTLEQIEINAKFMEVNQS